MPTITLNLQQCYKLPSNPPSEAWKNKPCDAEWLEKLTQILEENSLDIHSFEKHAKGSYQYLNDLLDSLKIVYLRLTGMLDTELGSLSADSKLAIFSKLGEDIDQCTPGFHNRVNAIVLGFFLPQSLEDLLYLVRAELIQRAATNATIGVHANNDFFRVANTCGYGVLPSHKNDIYHGHISDPDIKEFIQHAFKQNYLSPNLIIENLIAQIEAQLMSLGYRGNKGDTQEEAYVIGEYNSFRKFLCKILGFDEPSISIDTLFILTEDYHIVDINWNFVRKEILSILCRDQYFVVKDTPAQNITESLELLLFINDIEKFQSENYENSLFNFFIQTQNSNCLLGNLESKSKGAEQILKALRYFLEKGKLSSGQVSDFFTQSLRNRMNCLLLAAQHQQEAVKTVLEEMNYLLTNGHLTLNKVLEFFMQTDIEGSNCLILSAKQKNNALPEILNVLKSFIEKNYLTPEEAINFLQQTNNKEENCLHVAAQYNQNAMIPILLMLDQIKHAIPREQVVKFLSTRQQAHLPPYLTAAARGNHEIVRIIFKLVKDYLNTNEIADLLTTKDVVGNSCLLVAARHQPAAVQDIITIMQEVLPTKAMAEFFSRTDQNGYNCLLIAAIYQPKAVPIILDTMFNLLRDNHITSKQAKNFFTRKLYFSSEDCLLLAIDYQPNAIEPILKGMANLAKLGIININKSSLFSNLSRAVRYNINSISPFVSTIIQLQGEGALPSNTLATSFLNRNDGYNCLLLAARYQPSAVIQIFQIMDDLLERGDITKKEAENFFTEKRYFLNCLHLALKYQPEIASLILEKMNNLLERRVITSSQIRSFFFAKKINNKYIADHPGAFISILTCLTFCLESNWITPLEAAFYFIESEHDVSTFRLIAKDKSYAILPILKLVTNLISREDLSVNQVINFFIKNTRSKNFLGHIIWECPEKLQAIINRMFEILQPQQFKDIFLLFFAGNYISTSNGNCLFTATFRRDSNIIKIILDAIITATENGILTSEDITNFLLQTARCDPYADLGAQTSVMDFAYQRYPELMLDYILTLLNRNFLSREQGARCLLRYSWSNNSWSNNQLTSAATHFDTNLLIKHIKAINFLVEHDPTIRTQAVNFFVYRNIYEKNFLQLAIENGKVDCLDITIDTMLDHYQHDAINSKQLKKFFLSAKLPPETLENIFDKLLTIYIAKLIQTDVNEPKKINSSVHSNSSSLFGRGESSSHVENNLQDLATLSKEELSALIKKNPKYKELRDIYAFKHPEDPSPSCSMM